MLRSITKTVAVTVIGLALVVLASIVATDAANAAAPKEKTFPEGSVCFVIFQPHGSDSAVALFGPGIPEFTVRLHNGEWDQISFAGNNAVTPVASVWWSPTCPTPLPIPGDT